MTKFIIKYRWLIICTCLFLGIGFGSLIPGAKTDPEIRNYIPRDLPSRVATDKIENVFGVQDMVVILFSDSSILIPEDLKRIKEIDRGISRIRGISGRISPFTIKSIKSEKGMMLVDPLIKTIPNDTADAAKLKKAILDNRFARNIVFSSDLTTASITATISKLEAETVTLHKIDSVLASHPGKARILTGGLPYIRQHIMSDVRSDALILVPLALFIMLLILKFTLGDWKSVLMPFSVVLMSTAISMGIIPLLGWKISVLTLLVPIIIVAVANNYGIYLVARHQEIRRITEPGKGNTLGNIMGSLNMPILFSGLTTIAGILGLLAHSVIPARQDGILAASGVSIALLMSLTFVPALIYLTDSGIKKNRNKAARKKIFDKFLRRLSLIIINNPRKILVISVVATLLIFSGIFFLRIETNQEKYFPPNNPVRLASDIINKKFGGSQTISVMIEGDIMDPVLMHDIDSLTSDIEKLNGVGNVFSVSQVVKEISKAIYSPGEKEYNKIPVSRNAIAQMFELYFMSGDQSDFKQLINLDNTKAHVLIKLSKPENNVIKKVRSRISVLTAGFPAKITIGGYAIIMADFARSIITGQASSLAFAVLTVFFLLSIIFKSVKGGFTGLMPLVASILILFGFMGIAGIALDAATALLSSVMIGVGVDFTIQFLWCFNAELRKGYSYEKSTENTLSAIGRSIIINALSVMAGFSSLMLSGFVSIRFFGYLVFISIGSCLIGAIVVVPAFLITFRPKFIIMDLNNRKNRKYEKRNNIINVTSAAFTGSTATS
jgi:hydrophobe/amphiphile efflux-3 (HAE3) family protein